MANPWLKGPMLVVVPLSTMAAWQKEFATWAPSMNMVCYNGNQASRDTIKQFELESEGGELTFNVLLTSYEMVCKDKDYFQDIVWSNIVVDEAHRSGICNVNYTSLNQNYPWVGPEELTDC